MTNPSIWTLADAKTQHQYSPKLAYALSRIIPTKVPVYDFGCGKGDYISYLSSKGFKTVGYEGTEGIQELSNHKVPIHRQDLTIPFTVQEKGTVICLEVAEHIPAHLEGQLINNIVNACSNVLILSWAVKGQGGHGHVNEQNSDYVIPRIESEGFIYSGSKSLSLRSYGGKDLWWFDKSIYYFTKKQPII